jgi:hypothetical protein
MTLKFVFPCSHPGECLVGEIRNECPIFLTHDGVSGDLYLESEMSADALSEAVIEIRLTG